jgi:hypothetical protein
MLRQLISHSKSAFLLLWGPEREVLETAREHEDKVPRSVRRVMVSLIALGTILVTVGTSARAQNLTCTTVTLCKGGASCGGPGTVSGCKLDCRDGTTVYCLYKSGDDCPDCIIVAAAATRGTDVVTFGGYPIGREKGRVLLSFARAWATLDPKRSALLVKLAGTCGYPGTALVSGGSQ